MDLNNVFSKFIKRTATPEEVLELLKNIDAKEKGISDAVENEWKNTSFESHPDKDFHKIYQGINKTIYKKNKLIRPLIYLKWAATLSLLFIFSYLLYKFESQNNSVVVVNTEIETIEKINPNGQKSKIHLPDGSVAWLNSDSKLTFPSKFDSIRKVELIGEAFFEVAHNIEKPFVVQSENISTQALGTAFNVRAYKEENQIQVALTDGKVLVTVLNAERKDKNDFVIDPGLSITYWKDNDRIEKSEFSFIDVIGWKQGILVFNNAEKEDVFVQLSRWYGVEFEFINNNVNCRWKYNGQFKNENLENILISIGSIKHFNYQIDNSKVKIIYH
jgi:transmembrane sensor